MQRPISGSIGRRACHKGRSAHERHVQPPERRRKRVTGRLAHRLLASPKAQEVASTLVRRHGGEPGLFVFREEFTGETVSIHLPLRMFDVHADARPCRQHVPNADQCDAARVGHIEIQRRVSQFGTAAVPAHQPHRCRRDAKQRSQRTPQRRASNNPAPPQ